MQELQYIILFLSISSLLANVLLYRHVKKVDKTLKMILFLLIAEMIVDISAVFTALQKFAHENKVRSF